MYVHLHSQDMSGSLGRLCCQLAHTIICLCVYIYERYIYVCIWSHVYNLGESGWETPFFVACAYMCSHEHVCIFIDCVYISMYAYKHSNAHVFMITHICMCI